MHGFDNSNLQQLVNKTNNNFDNVFLQIFTSCIWWFFLSFFSLQVFDQGQYRGNWADVNVGASNQRFVAYLFVHQFIRLNFFSLPILIAYRNALFWPQIKKHVCNILNSVEISTNWFTQVKKKIRLPNDNKYS